LERVWSKRWRRKEQVMPRHHTGVAGSRVRGKKGRKSGRYWLAATNKKSGSASGL